MIIFLNGVGSSGKTTLAKAIQHCSSKPLLKIGIDDFINMMPESYLGFNKNAHLGFKFVEDKDSEEHKSIPKVEIESGEFGKMITSTMPKVIKVLASTGFDIIIDEVLLGDTQLAQYVEAFKGITVYFIGIKCSLDVIEEREILRGDRVIGLGRGQYDKVHAGMREYDMMLDTATAVNGKSSSIFEYANQILKYIQNNPSPLGFIKMEKAFNLSDNS